MEDKVDEEERTMGELWHSWPAYLVSKSNTETRNLYLKSGREYESHSLLSQRRLNETLAQKEKKARYEPGMVANTFILSTPEVDTGESLSFMSSWATY